MEVCQDSNVELTKNNVNQLRLQMGYVIQEGGLFPHLTARGNVELQPRFLRYPLDKIRKRVEELADLVQLSTGLLSRYPKDLSGGQRQRVGLMRSLMLDPDCVLLDEPLGSLDPITRRELQDELKAGVVRGHALLEPLVGRALVAAVLSPPDEQLPGLADHIKLAS